MSKKISIITPNYNYANYIGYTIESIIEQDYKNWELIIVDDGSTDNGLAIVKNYIKNDNRIILLENTINLGAAKTRNKAVDIAKGRFIAFLDSDDLWLPIFIEKQLKLIKKDNFTLCYTGGYLIDENSKEIGSFLPKYNNGFIFKNMLRRYEINNQSVMIKREVFRKFNEDITIGEDYNLFMEIVLNNKVCNIKEKLIKYRVHGSSITKSHKKDLSEGTLFTLSELNNKYSIFYKHPLSYIYCWLKAIRFKFWMSEN